MAVDSFVPQIWRSTLQVALEKTYVLAEPGVTVNTDFEGDLSQAGVSVRITSVGDPTVANYVKNVTVIDPQTLSTTDSVFTIDQAKYFAFELDDIDRAQTVDDGKLMTEAARRSAVILKDGADTFVGAKMKADAGTKLGAFTPANGDDAYAIVVKLMVALDKANVPREGRFLVVSPDFYALLITDKRFTDASAYGQAGVLVTGEVGRILGFTVKVSTNVPAGTTVASKVPNMVIAGTPQATTWASQINKVEAYRPPNSFSDAVKGLFVYGAKVQRPEFLATADVAV